MPPPIPNYRLIHPIGEGGFGQVWLAETVTGKPRAVKMVHRARFASAGLSPAEVEELFQLEFKGVQRFEDLSAEAPGLITIQHVGRDEEGGFYYYVMPLADDARLTTNEGNYHPLNLQQKIERDGAMEWDAAMALLRELAAGLDQLHRAGLCHGDISSANVLFLDGKAVLGDPGLTSRDGRATLTRSPGFSDPDIGSNSDYRSDIFALGRVFYHAATGLHPAESFPLVPCDRMSGMPVAEFADLLDRCGDPDPEARFQKAAELVEFISPEESLKQASASGLSPVTWIIGLSAVAGVTLGARTLMDGFENQIPSHVDIGDGRITVYAEAGGEVIWAKDLGMKLIQAEVVDLDEDGTLEVLCAVVDIGNGNKEGGRMLAFESDGTLRWSFDTTMDFQNYSQLGKGAMALIGFMVEDLDGETGKELILNTRSSGNLVPMSIAILGHDGAWRASYWHPGHLFPENFLLVRERQDSLPLLAFHGFNNAFGKKLTDLPSGQQQHRSAVGVLNPRVRGHHEAPPGNGELGGKDGMTEWYYLVEPQHAGFLSMHAEDSNGDGMQELVLWVVGSRDHEDPKRHTYQSFTLDLQGNVLTQRRGDGHAADAQLLQIIKSGSRTNEPLPPTRPLTAGDGGA